MKYVINDNLRALHNHVSQLMLRLIFVRKDWPCIRLIFSWEKVRVSVDNLRARRDPLILGASVVPCIFRGASKEMIVIGWLLLNPSIPIISQSSVFRFDISSCPWCYTSWSCRTSDTRPRAKRAEMRPLSSLAVSVACPCHTARVAFVTLFRFV